MDRPDIEEALESLTERAEHALTLAAEAYQTPDGEDEKGNLDPIFAYSAHKTRDTFPLAVIGLFYLLAKQQERLDNVRPRR